MYESLISAEFKNDGPPFANANFSRLFLINIFGDAADFDYQMF